MCVIAKTGNTGKPPSRFKVQMADGRHPAAIIIAAPSADSMFCGCAVNNKATIRTPRPSQNGRASGAATNSRRFRRVAGSVVVNIGRLVILADRPPIGDIPEVGFQTSEVRSRINLSTPQHLNVFFRCPISAFQFSAFQHLPLNTSTSFSARPLTPFQLLGYQILSPAA